MTDQLDPFAILAALGVMDAESATPVTGGADTALWRVERGAETFALRVFRPEQATVCRREAAAMAAASGRVPVPRVIVAGAWQDRPALLLSWCAGETLGAALQREPGRAGQHHGHGHARRHRRRRHHQPYGRHGYPL